MHDVVVIGGSFAGLAASLQLVRARRDVLVLDAGKPRNRNARRAHGFLTRDGAIPADLLSAARDEVSAYPDFKVAAATVVAARRITEGFEVECDDGTAHQARRLVLAYGVVDQLDDLPGFAECWGRTVLHCPYCHAYEVAGQRLGLLVRHGSELQLARLYRDWSSDLTLFTAGAPIDPNVRDQVEQLGVRVIETAVLRLDHSDGDLNAVVTAEGPVPIDALFAHPPYDFASPVGQDLGCEVIEFEDGSRGLLVDVFHETSVKGVYAAGDIARPVHSISAAVGDGAGAGINCHQSFSVPRN